MCLSSDQVDDALTVVDDALEQFLVYMGHKACCTNQTSAIKCIEEDIKQRCIDSKGSNVRGILVMDFKMKFNPISVRESTLDHYGKRGISWHGFCLIYYMYDSDLRDAIRYCIYLDQILSNGNK